MNRYSPVSPAGVPVAPLSGAPATQPCLACEGEGEVEIMALDEVRPHWELCGECDGTGVSTRPYCETCQGKLTVDGFCYACDDYGLSGWALAEHSAYGMGLAR